ncbi:MAG: hypothetical protein ABSC25_18400 [Roseiarcus sp.]|jgi:hypothetical protein
MRRALTALFLLALASPAAAQSGTCARDLADADALVAAVQAREKDFSENDDAKNCRLLRQNRADMVAATAIMRRCLTGHDRSENVGQMEDSLGDIDAVLAAKCR